MTMRQVIVECSFDFFQIMKSTWDRNVGVKKKQCQVWQNLFRTFELFKRCKQVGEVQF